VVLNDPGRLLSSHLYHTSVVAGWCGLMLGYDNLVVDPTDPVFNPIWRQGSYLLPFSNRLGLGGYHSGAPMEWNYDTVSASHLILSSLVAISGCWHWSYWDLDIFLDSSSNTFALDLPTVFGIHLLLASLLCYGYGSIHLSGAGGPGMWTADAFGLVGSARFVKPTYNLIGLSPFCYGVITSHHQVSGLVGCAVSLWHISARPSRSIYRYLCISSIESVLASSISAVFFASLITSGTMWYGSSTTVDELYGPTRYHSDNAYFTLEIAAHDVHAEVKKVRLRT
jgi:photosystem II CP47 chlorophyll apoprotein